MVTAGLSGCQALNANIGLDGATLSALDTSPASRIHSTKPSIDESFDRRHWPVLTVAVPIRQIEHRPTYAPALARPSQSNDGTAGGWRHDTYPTLASVLTAARYDQDSASGAAMTLLHGVGLVFWAPIDVIVNQRPPWAVERSPAVSYERIPGPSSATIEQLLHDDGSQSVVPLVLLMCGGRRRTGQRPRRPQCHWCVGATLVLLTAMGCSEIRGSGADAGAQSGDDAESSATAPQASNSQVNGQPDIPRLVDDMARIDAQYAAVLDSLVNDDGRVAYASLEVDRTLLDALGNVVDGYANLGRPMNQDRLLAFLCNAYNSNMILHAFIESQRPGFVTIAQVPGFFAEPRLTVMGQQTSFHSLEQQCLREAGRGMVAARLHSALVRAAVGAPPMRHEPYDADRFASQLEDQSRRWVNDPRLNRAVSEDSISVSVIFDWFREDFENAAADAGVDMATWTDGVRYFLREHVDAASPLGQVLEAHESPTVFWEVYDWSLNDVRARPLADPDE